MKSSFASLVLAGAFACSLSAQPVVATVVDKMSYRAVLAPNCWVVIKGYNFAPSTR
jgi:hypothetical protein